MTSATLNRFGFGIVLAGLLAALVLAGASLIPRHPPEEKQRQPSPEELDRLAKPYFDRAAANVPAAAKELSSAGNLAFLAYLMVWRPDSRQSAPQIRLLTLLCPLDQLFDERLIHMENIALHNPVDHPLIQRQQGICRTFVEIFQRRRSHRKSLVAEHPRLTFQGDGILHFIRNHFGNERGVITGSAAD